MNVLKSLLVLVLLLFWAPCLVQSDQSGSNSQLVVYIETPPNEDMEVELVFDNLILYSDIDTTFVSLNSLEINSIDLSNNQTIFLELNIQPAEYKKMILFLKKVHTYAGPARIEPLFDSTGIEIDLDFKLSENQVMPLFIKWNPNKSEYVNKTYKPNFRLIPHKTAPRGAAIFVTNQDSNNLTLVDRTSNRVIDIIKLDQSPCDMIYSDIHEELYIANNKSHTITVIDINLQKIIRIIYLENIDRPIDLDMSGDQTSLYILCQNSDRLLTYNLSSYQEISAYNLSFTPYEMTFDNGSGDVYITGQNSSEFLIYNINENREINSIAINGQGASIEHSSRSKLLFVALQHQRTLLIYDLESGSLKHTLEFCAPVSYIAYDEISDILYTAMKGCREIDMVQTSNGLIINSINLDYSPGKITLDPESKQLYVTSPEENKLYIYHESNLKLTSVFNVGRKPYMALVP